MLQFNPFNPAQKVPRFGGVLIINSDGTTEGGNDTSKKREWNSDKPEMGGGESHQPEMDRGGNSRRPEIDDRYTPQPRLEEIIPDRIKRKDEDPDGWRPGLGTPNDIFKIINRKKPEKPTMN